MILPNNGNVILTAQQVDAIATDVAVRVVPTRNLPQGITALLAFDPGVDLDGNCARMDGRHRAGHALEVTRAVRDSTANGHEIKAGDVLGIVDDGIREVGDRRARRHRGGARGGRRGPGAGHRLPRRRRTAADADALVERLRERSPQTEFEVHDGGQEHYSYVLSLE